MARRRAPARRADEAPRRIAMPGRAAAAPRTSRPPHLSHQRYQHFTLRSSRRISDNRQQSRCVDGHPAKPTEADRPDPRRPCDGGAGRARPRVAHDRAHPHGAGGRRVLHLGHRGRRDRRVRALVRPRRRGRRNRPARDRSRELGAVHARRPAGPRQRGIRPTPGHVGGRGRPGRAAVLRVAGGLRRGPLRRVPARGDPRAVAARRARRGQRPRHCGSRQPHRRPLASLAAGPARRRQHVRAVGLDSAGRARRHRDLGSRRRHGVWIRPAAGPCVERGPAVRPDLVAAACDDGPCGRRRACARAAGHGQRRQHRPARRGAPAAAIARPHADGPARRHLRPARHRRSRLRDRRAGAA